MLKDKIVLVTGSAQGIGKSIAEAFIHAGANVMMNDVNQQELEKSVQDVCSIGANAKSYVADVSKDEDVKRMIEDIVLQNGGIDILVNNAGVSLKNPDNTKKFTLDLTVEEWDYILGVNLRSVFLCSKYAAQHMIKNRYGKIVNMSSILGKVGGAGEKYDNYHPISSTSASHYCASKAGIIGFTRSLARELAKYGVNVNAVAPGAVWGGMGRFNSEVIERMKTQIPLGDLATGQDVANTVLFLCSESAKYITGETLNVNGGWLMD